MHFDNLLFVVIGTAFVLLRLLAQRAAKASNEKRNEQQQPRAPITRSDNGDTDEERVRRLLEALGQPATAKPPAKVAPRVITPTAPKSSAAAPAEAGREKFEQSRRALRKTWANPLPPLTTVPPTVAAEVPPRVTPEPRIRSSSLQKVASTTPLRVAPLADEITVQRADALSELLRSPAQLRQAIVLREIFGPPRALQMLESL